MHWFTADPHYGHDRIIGFCDRPFPDVAAMNTHLLAACQTRVGPDDDLWILGDFTAGRATDAQRREVRVIYHALPGRKHLIRGNHDENWVRDLPWDSVSETADIVVDKRRLFLCHYPMITWPGARHQPRRKCHPKPGHEPPQRICSPVMTRAAGTGPASPASSAHAR